MINAMDIPLADGDPTNGPRCPVCGVLLIQQRRVQPNGSAPLGYRHPKAPFACSLVDLWMTALGWCTLAGREKEMAERRTAMASRG